MLSFNCPACQHYGDADDGMAGEIIGCAKCMTHFRLPMRQEPAPPAPSLETRISVKEPGKGAVVEAWARCPMCAARRIGTPRCTFCGYVFQTAETIQIEQVRRQRRQTGTQAGAVLGFILVVLGLPSFVYYVIWTHEDELRLCRENLLILHNAIQIVGERPPGVPKDVGRRFLVAVAQRERISLLCPSVDRKAFYRPVDFRGPRRPWEELLPEDPVAADIEGNHSGVTILLKSGEIQYASKGSYLYRRALEETVE